MNEIKYNNYWEEFLRIKDKCNIKINKDSREMVAAELLEPCDKLLDIGCGDGIFSILAKGKYKNYYGCDISEVALRKASELGCIVKKINLDKEEIVDWEKDFDYVICLDVIEHVFDPEYLVKNINNALKIGGKLIISTPNIRFIKYILSIILT